MRAINGLKISWEDGEGDVVLAPKFMKESALFRADVLQDWCCALEELYKAARIDMSVEYGRTTRAAYLKLREEKRREALVEQDGLARILGGKTIQKVERFDDGAVSLWFTDGSQHALYHGIMSKEAPVLISDNLAACPKAFVCPQS